MEVGRGLDRKSRKNRREVKDLEAKVRRIDRFRSLQTGSNQIFQINRKPKVRNKYLLKYNLLNHYILLSSQKQ
jgi:hypothetical protein